jgi:predicted ferric reductase
MHPGLDPRTRLLRWSLSITAVAIVLAATGPDAFDAVTGWVRDEYERLPWYLIRLSGWLAYLALTVSVIYGLLLSTKVLDAIAQRTISFTLHQDLASIGLCLGLVHAAVLMIDRSVPFTPVEVVVPLLAPYRPLWVAFGQLALGLSVVLVGSFYVRRRIGQATWRRIHHVSFLAFVAMTVHGVMSGTDSGTSWARWGYLVPLAMVAFLLTYRVVQSLAARRDPRSGAQPRARAADPPPGVLQRSDAAAAAATEPVSVPR